MESLEFEALAEEEFEDEGLGGMDVGESGLDMLGDEDNGAMDDIEAKMDLE